MWRQACDERTRPIDLLTQAVEFVRADLDRSIPVQQRARIFWAGVCCARALASAEIVTEQFTRLARETLLIHDLVQSGGSFNGRETIAHLIRCGLIEGDPFGGMTS